MAAHNSSGRVFFEGFEANLDSGELRKHGVRIKIHEQPFRILAVLLERPGELITRLELRQRLWAADTFVDFDVGLNSAVKKLRDALGDSVGSPRFIETLPRHGYRFIAKVDSVRGGSTAGDTSGECFGGVAPVTPATGPETSGEKPRSPSLQARDFLVRAPRRQYLYLLAFLSTAALLAVMVGLNAVGLSGRLLGRADAKPIRSLAVLPLENLSGDPLQQYFSDGLTELLITDLGKIPGLRVISRTSVMHYRGTQKTLPEIARELSVDAIIEGAVMRSKGRVRITTQLVQARDDRHLWAEEYDRDASDILAMQDEVARDIALQVRSKLSPQTGSYPGRSHSVSAEAQDAYLRGRFEWNKWNADGLTKSIEYFQEATERDPGYAEAWAGLSDGYAFLKLFDTWPSQLALPKAKAAALKALELNESLSEAHVSLAMVAMQSFERGSLPVAEKELLRAIELNANNAMAHQYYGYLLAATGRFDEGIAAMKRARELDPLSPNTQNSMGAALFWARHYDEALQQFQEVPDPDLNSEVRHRRIAEIYERKGMQKEAIAALLTATRLAGKDQLAHLVLRKYLSSGYQEAKRLFLRSDLRELLLRAQHNQPISARSVAVDYSLLGERDKALKWLEKAVRDNDAKLLFLKVDDSFETLRPDARFQALLSRLGLLP